MPDIIGYLVIRQGLSNPVGLVSHHGLDGYDDAVAAAEYVMATDVDPLDVDSVVAIIPMYALFKNVA